MIGCILRVLYFKPDGTGKAISQEQLPGTVVFLVHLLWFNLVISRRMVTATIDKTLYNRIRKLKGASIGTFT